VCEFFTINTKQITHTTATMLSTTTATVPHVGQEDVGEVKEEISETANADW